MKPGTPWWVEAVDNGDPPCTSASEGTGARIETDRAEDPGDREEEPGLGALLLEPMEGVAGRDEPDEPVLLLLLLLLSPSLR